MLLNKLKVLVRLGLVAALAFALSQVPVVKRELSKFNIKIETSASVNTQKIVALESRAAELERRADAQDKVAFEQDARLTVLNNRVRELETPKKKNSLWRNL